MAETPKPPLNERMAGMINSSMGTYREHGERAALRCAMGDAAHICDMLGQQILDNTRGRGGKGAYTVLGKQLAATAKMCGDKIWELRDQIGFEGEQDASADPVANRQAGA